MTRRKLSDGDAARVKTLRDMGWTMRQIADEMHVSTFSIHKIVSGTLYRHPSRTALRTAHKPDVSPAIEAMRMVREFKLPPLPRPVLDYDPNYGRSYGLAPGRVSSRVERGEK